MVAINLFVAGLVAVAIERNRTRDSEQAAVTLRNLEWRRLGDDLVVIGYC